MIIRESTLRTIPAIAFGLFISANVWAGDITLSLEEPTANSTYTGVANIRGYAYSKQSNTRVQLKDIELYIDGKLQGSIPFGGRRDDVTADPNSGFSMAFNYASLAQGQHKIEIVAVDQQGSQKQVTANFNTVRFNFPGDFLHDPNKVNLSGSQISQQGNRITINNMSADGQKYDIELTWNTPTQNFTITKIAQKGSENIPDFSGKYSLKSGYQCTSAAGTNPLISFGESTSMSNLPMTQNGSSIELASRWKGDVNAKGEYILTRTVDKTVQNCRFNYIEGYIGNFNTGQIVMGIDLEGYKKSCPTLPALECKYTVDPSLKRTGPLN